MQSREIFGDGLGGDGSGFLPLFILLKARQLLKIQCPETPQPTQSETIDRNTLRGVNAVVEKPVGVLRNLRPAT